MAVPTPNPAGFIWTPVVHTGVTGAIPPILIDDPTIAVKLTTPFGVPAAFEIWFAWEDIVVPPPVILPDIWYHVGTYTSVPPAFALAPGGPWRVPYVPPVAIDTEQNPELWNRNDALRLNPPVTHLVFDRNPHPIGGGMEVEYIDP